MIKRERERERERRERRERKRERKKEEYKKIESNSFRDNFKFCDYCLLSRTNLHIMPHTF